MSTYHITSTFVVLIFARAIILLVLRAISVTTIAIILLYYIKEVNGMSPDKMIRRPVFDRLTPIYPNERFDLETARTELRHESLI